MAASGGSGGGSIALLSVGLTEKICLHLFGSTARYRLCCRSTTTERTTIPRCLFVLSGRRDSKQQRQQCVCGRLGVAGAASWNCFLSAFVVNDRRGEARRGEASTLVVHIKRGWHVYNQPRPHACLTPTQLCSYSFFCCFL